MLSLALACLTLTGCLSQSEREYRERQNRHFSDKDVAMKMEQRAAGEFPEVLAQMRAAFDRGGELVTPKLLTATKPKYPAGKARKGVQSGVWVAFVVRTDGTVRDARALPDETMPADPAMVEAALVAVRQWRFSPASADGNPLEFLLCVPVLFELRAGI